jgi:hypothetical protein
VWLATRNAESAASVKASGLRVTGIGGAVSVDAPDVAALDEYSACDAFDLIVLATKAHHAIAPTPGLVEAAPELLGHEPSGSGQACRHGGCRRLGWTAVAGFVWLVPMPVPHRRL